MIHLPFTREWTRGDLIRGDIRIPEGPPPRSAVVVVHGFKGFKDWAFFPWLCRRLAAAGHAVVSFDFSRNGIGGSSDRFTDLDRFRTNTLSVEAAELGAVLREVREGDLLPRRPRRIGLLGHSRGGGQAILAAGGPAPVDALVTLAAVSTFDRWSEEDVAEWRAGGVLWVLNARTGQQMPVGVELLDDYVANRDALDVAAAAGRVQAPWLVIHGVEDVTVPFEEARTLAAAGPSARLRPIEGTGHTFGVGHPFEKPSEALEEVARAAVTHFERHLKGEGEASG